MNVDGANGLAEARLEPVPIDDGLAPIPPSRRVMGTSSYAAAWWAVWYGITVIMFGQGMAPRVGSRAALLISVIVSALTTLAFVFGSVPGYRYGIPFVIQSRAIFGQKGAKVASLLRSLPAVVWVGIGSWISALCLDQITRSLFGYGNPMLYFILLQFLQTVLVYYGIHSIKVVDILVAAIAGAILTYMLVVMIRQHGWPSVPAAQPVSLGTLLPMIASGLGFGLITTTSVSDTSRYLRVKRGVTWTSHLLGVFPPFFLACVLGAEVGLLLGPNDTVAAFVRLAPNPVLADLLMVAIIFGRVAANLTINMTPAINSLMEMFDFSWRKASVVTGILSLLTVPWLLTQSAAYLLFLAAYSCFVGPLVAILLADYWIVRRREYRLSEMYPNSSDGSVRAVKWPAMIALALGALTALLNVQLSWEIGAPVAFVAYLVLSRRSETVAV